jgi:PAS domain S-box-containing protein
MDLQKTKTAYIASLPSAREDQLQLSNFHSLLMKEEKLRGLYAHSPLGIALTDMQGRYIDFNKPFRHTCGYAEQELKTLDYWTLTPKEYEAQEAIQLQLLERTGYYGPYEKEYVHTDGSRIPLRLSGMLVTGPNGQPRIWSIVENRPTGRPNSVTPGRGTHWQADKAAFDKVLRAYFALADLQETVGATALSELDNAFYRMVEMMMLNPGLFLDSESGVNTRTDARTLNQLCDYITSNLDQTLTLAILERFSGLSARALQYAFRRKFGCTPMQWVRRQRLESVHRLLSSPPRHQGSNPGGGKVTAIALSCGFTHLGAFAGYYYARYGERPSETLARTQRRY